MNSLVLSASNSDSSVYLKLKYLIQSYIELNGLEIKIQESLYNKSVADVKKINPISVFYKNSVLNFDERSNFKPIISELLAKIKSDLQSNEGSCV